MRSKHLFRFLLGTIVALSGVAASAQAQTTPTNNQLIDRILASAKPGDKLVRSGDMLLSVAALREYRGKIGAGKQAASAFFRVQLWTGVGGKVPYILDDTLDPAQKPLFLEACRELETVAGLKFLPRTNQTDYIRVFTDPTAIGFSYSAVGRVGGKQDLSLNKFGNRYTAVHEIMHALGLMHEQSRSDRDKFVTIDFSNITADSQSQFAIVNDSNNQGVYDFDSVMHYGPGAFAIDPSKPVIIVKAPNERFQSKIGQSSHISVIDKQGLFNIYGPPFSTLPPANDNFANAEVIEGPSGGVRGTNKFATEEPGEDAATKNNASASIWYLWRPTSSGTVTFNTKGSAIDTTLGVYQGSSLTTLTQVAFNDDEVTGASSPATGLTSLVTFKAQVGATYYLAVDSFSDFLNTGPTGEIRLNWSQRVEASNLTLSGSVKTTGSPALGVSGVTISLTGADNSNSAAAATATTNGSGEYSFARLPAGSYDLRASKTGFSFSPTALRVNLTVNSTGNNFTATQVPAASIPELYVSDVAVREGNSGNSFVTFNVSLSIPSQDNVTVRYETVNGSASSESDYAATRGTLTFAPGTVSLTVNVRLRPDTTVEPDETFMLKLSNATGARIADDTGVATIINDDVAASAARGAVDPSARSSKLEGRTRLSLLSSSRN